MMSAPRAVNEEPIPGYRLLEPLGRGGFGEVWKAEAPGGLFKAIKFVRGNDDSLHGSNGAEQELRALQHIKSIRHPFLLSIERVEIVEGDLVIVLELADRSLHDLLEENRKAGRIGLPRNEALGYLREAAEVLDLMNLEHGLQHLDVKPRNLFLIGRHVKVADFGLVNSLAELSGEGDRNLLGAITPQYAAPETFEGQVTPFSDQYSLAVTYHELLTGKLPLEAKNVHQLALLVSTTPPNLERLHEADRPIVRQALAKDPRERFASCTAFLAALQSALPPPGSHPPAPARTTSGDPSPGETEAHPVADTARDSGGSSGFDPPTSRTTPAAGPPDAPASAGPLPGYELLECLGRGPGGEAWRARGPEGEARQVRFLTLPGANNPSPRENPLERLLGLRHEALPGLQLVPLAGDRAALISEAGDASLLSRLKECQAAGQPGIPRLELLAWLADAADALDDLHHLHQLQHLALSPRHLARRGEQLLLLDFALAQLLWLPEGLQPAALNPRYSAVELFDGPPSDACDQYSLALLYQEMLVGLHPFRNLNARQLASPRLRGLPDVSLLPGRDRPIVLQALEPEPQMRFPSCREFIHALQEATQQVEPVASPSPVMAPAPFRKTASSGQVPRPGAALAWRSAVDELVQAAGRGQQVLSSGSLHYRFAPGSQIEHRCSARLVPGMGRLKIDGFRQQWRGARKLWTPSRYVIDLPTTGTLLERCLGRTPGLVVDVCLGAPRENQTPIRVTIQPMAGGRGRAEQLLSVAGPLLLESLQTYLASQSERAAQERFPLSQTVCVQPQSGPAVTAQMRDVGREGLSVYSPSPLPVGPVTLTLTRWESTVTVQAPGWVRDCFADGGRFEIEIALGG
jgi:serine/threonine protein kinase